MSKEKKVYISHMGDMDLFLLKKKKGEADKKISMQLQK